MLALIAIANVMIYLHGRPYGPRQHIVEDGAVDRTVTAATVILVDARAYPLFAALFGYGLVRIIRNQRARGFGERAALAAVRRRSRWLIALGLVHGVLAFSGDILGWYGLLGLIVAGMLNMRDRTLLWLAGSWLIVASGVQGLVYAGSGISNQRSFMWSFAIADPGRAAAWRALEWVTSPIGLLAVATPLLIGVWAARHRILENPDRHRTLLRRTAALGLSGGVVGGIGMALVTIQAVKTSDAVTVGLSWMHIATGVPMGLAYVAVIALWSARLRNRCGAGTPRIISALQAAGERSLSCYLAQTVVFASLLPAWSLGAGAVLGTGGATLLALATWATTVAGAALMDRLGRRGPAEALLRRLSYGRPLLPPLRGTIVSWKRYRNR